MLRKIVVQNREDLWLYVSVEGGLFLLAQLVTGWIVAVRNPGSVTLLSGALLPAAAAILVLIASLSYVMVFFQTALRFSQTRRRALGLTVGLTGVQAAFALGLAALLAAVERWLCPWLWAALAGKEGWGVLEQAGPPPDGARLWIEPVALDGWLWPLFAAAGLALGLILGAVVQRYGGKGAWAIWGIWMAASFGPQLQGGNILAIGAWTPAMVGACAVTAAVALVWAVWSLLHAVVKT